MATERKITVSLDEELLHALESEGSVSAQLNVAGWELVDRRRRHADLVALLDRLDEEDGPLPDDPEEDARLERLLGGAA